ncbi:hypothetical protein AC1031_012153 [Aphanomyces cochlioides]|nr:hypothetical protein AC1031_012153 [Aphanomyces cochlioides]
MVHYEIAGCVEHSDYTICERLLDIMATVLPDIKVTKEPRSLSQWPPRALEIDQTFGFSVIGKRDVKVAQVLVWRLGRLVAHRAEEFQLYVAEHYGLALDLSKEQIEAYTAANVLEVVWETPQVVDELIE